MRSINLGSKFKRQNWVWQRKSGAGNCVMGNHFLISAESAVVKHKKIFIGNDVLLSWDGLILDTDLHEIYAEDASFINLPKTVIIGNKV